MTSQPLSQSNRIESIDVLRGFTLFGIMLVHMVEQYYAGPPPEIASTNSVADTIAGSFTGIFIMGKFYMIFSFLFGLSFFIQSSKRDSGFLMRFAWRLLILFGIGFIHHLHYRGDILTIYAMLGLGLLLFSWLPDRLLLIVAILLVLDVPALATRIIQELFAAANQPGSIFNQDQAVLMKYYNTVKSGTYPEILQANLAEFTTKMKFQVESGRLYITLGLFLLGVYAGRRKWFEALDAKRQSLKKVIRYSLWSLLGVIVTGIAVFGGANAIGVPVTQSVQMMLGMFFYDLFNCALASFYVAGILLLFQSEKWTGRLMIFYPVGRMGLSIYLLQSVMGTLIFFSFGLGLLYEFGAAVALIIGIVLFTIQILFARRWFVYFQYGPVEWLWRSLTYLKIQPMRKRTVSPAAA